ncbi:RILP-like protein homolog isoform X2 [Bemisia tabaci]|uniref:RILP-like protein homolog isoform X2 n=1 Tax=Bemisia tabaci TaxID=7038 RepID=UPI0008F9E0F5|nr:PREDICTED: RILP-like protein homolog isoform X3 [Bemisia tabaci]
MPYAVSNSPVMESPKPDISVIDVYDLASEIGSEFEKIIDVFGVDAVTSLMRKVINALELLEGMAAKSDQENLTIQDLQARINKLEREKEEKRRFEKEVEQVEDMWRAEVDQYQAMVQKLQEDNMRLTRLLALSEDESLAARTQSVATEVDVATVQELNSTIEQLKRQLRTKDRELASKSTDIENLSNQVERFTSLKKEFRRKQNISQTQMRALAEERADLLVQLQDKRKEVKVLCHRLGIAQKENEDLANSSMDSPDLRNKVVFDVHDPDRPRFTATELKDIIQERNELKVKNSNLEEELEAFKPKPTVKVESPEDEDPPVQGPLPCEPDDAPWKKSETGIRKFFRKLFSETNKMSFLGDSPKRSLSSLSKISGTSGYTSGVESLP